MTNGRHYYVTEDGGVACDDALLYEADTLRPGEAAIIARLENEGVETLVADVLRLTEENAALKEALQVTADSRNDFAHRLTTIMALCDEYRDTYPNGVGKGFQIVAQIKAMAKDGIL